MDRVEDEFGEEDLIAPFVDLVALVWHRFEGEILTRKRHMAMAGSRKDDAVSRKGPS